MSDKNIEAFVVVANLLEDSFHNKGLHKEFVKYAKSCAAFYRNLEQPESWKEVHFKLSSIEAGYYEVDALTPWGALITLLSKDMACDDRKVINKIGVKNLSAFEVFDACDFAMSLNLGSTIKNLYYSSLHNSDNKLMKLSGITEGYEADSFTTTEIISQSILPVTLHMMIEKIGLDRTLLTLITLFETPYEGSRTNIVGGSFQTYRIRDFEKTLKNQFSETTVTFERILTVINSIADDSEEAFPIDWHLASIV